MAKKQKNNSHGAHHAAHATASPRREMVATIIMTVVITAAVLIAAFLIYNAIGHSGIGTQSASGSGKVTMIEYSDFQCPFCGKAYPTIKQLEQQYGDKLQIVFKQFPLPFHPFAQKAAEASLCAQDQGKFWQLHDMMFTHQDALAVSDLKNYAAQLGLDTAKFNACLDSGEKAAQIDADKAEGQKLGVSGTPTFFIGSDQIVGAQPIENFQAAINKALGSNAPTTPSAGSTPTPAAADTSKDPKLSFTVIEDSSCTTCQVDQQFAAIKNVFPSATLDTRLEAKDSAALIAKYNLSALPAFFVNSDVTKAANYQRVASSFNIESDGNYLIKPGSTGPTKLLAPIDLTGAPIIGAANATVTVVEFADFSCPYCAAASGDNPSLTATMKQQSASWEPIVTNLMKDYVNTGKVRFAVRYAFGHSGGKPAQLVAWCLNDQNLYWKFYPQAFANQADVEDLSKMEALAKTLGADMTQLQSCLDTKKYDDRLNTEQAQATALGIQGTPGFFVNGVLVTGAVPYSQFKATVDEALSQ